MIGRGALRRRRLLGSLTDEDETKRWEAAKALCELGDARMSQRLQEMLESDEDPRAKAAAAYVLGFLGDTDAADALAATLANLDEDAAVRAYAAEALGHLLQYEPVLADVRTAILSGLRDPSPEVRFWSAFSAGVLGLQESRPHLARLARTDEQVIAGWWSVAEEAEWALRVLDGEPDPPLPPREPREPTPPA